MREPRALTWSTQPVKAVHVRGIADSDVSNVLGVPAVLS
jgi:hypothetical protein